MCSRFFFDTVGGGIGIISEKWTIPFYVKNQARTRTTSPGTFRALTLEVPKAFPFHIHFVIHCNCLFVFINN